ncbi:MAG: Kelch repeat type 2-containing protein [Bacteroidetes bacterium]|jgi:N-acetylneuraminic acid mutarotase|nr:Kelch repeat type 2-containing protein [Bacteroidota bacterium]
MKKSLRLCITGLLLACFFTINAQAPSWTWMKGSNTIDQGGIYGTLGVGAAANNPGARLGSATWKDNNGNLWLFGGYGFDANSQDYLNDLWKYDINLNQWIWISGPNTISSLGVYGTMGVPATTNSPGARAWCASWVDNSGNFWLFGGEGSDSFMTGELLNDLWKYNPLTNEWTWMGGSNLGSQYGVYGTQGVAASTNSPGGRHVTTYWKDNNGNFYIFGGYGLAVTSAPDYLNDLWKYNPLTNEWTWLKGANTYNQTGIYGTLGVGAATNAPGARDGASYWTDNNNNLWLFGGTPYANSYFNDLWKYNVALDEWTWVRGSNSVNQVATYGTQGVGASSNDPGARQFANAWYNNGELWVYGGFGFNAISDALLQDLWKYNIASNQWIWIGGTTLLDQAGNYGTQNVTTATNLPGSRGFQPTWADNNNLWLFGGVGFGNSALLSGFLNDLWRISFCTPPAAPSNGTPAANLTICSNTITSLTGIVGGGNINWFSAPTGGSPLGSGVIYNTPVLNASGAPSTYTYYAEAFTCAPSATRTPITVTVNPLPSVNATSSSSLLCVGQSATLTANGASNYTWNPGTNATVQVVSPAVTTNYTVTGTSSAGCTNTATITQSVSACTALNELIANNEVNVYPNPVSSKITISVSSRTHYVLDIYNSLGALVYSSNIIDEKTVIDVNSLANGVYFIRLKNNEEIILKKIIKQ